MTPNNNLMILPFYDEIKYQNHRKDYAQGEVFTVHSLIKTILPFQIFRKTSSTAQFTVTLYQGIEGLNPIDITQQMLDTGLSAITVSGYNLIKYNGILPMTIPMSIGQYYITINDGTDTYYSDIFTSVSSVDDCLKIEYSNKEDFEWESGVISYSGGYKNIVYLPTELGRPEYIFEEDGENRDGHLFVKKQISEKTFKFDFLASEYLLDAMRIIRLSDDITITNKGQVYNAVEFLITPEWQTGGFLASVDSEFQSDTVIKRIGAGYTGEKGDYNNDYNNDFKIN